MVGAGGGPGRLVGRGRQREESGEGGRSSNPQGACLEVWGNRSSQAAREYLWCDEYVCGCWQCTAASIMPPPNRAIKNSRLMLVAGGFC